MTENTTSYLALFASIDPKTAEEFVKCIAALPPETRVLQVLLSTRGGTLSDGFAIYHILKALPYEIVMHNIGNVDSIGNIIFLAGKRRYASSKATFLIHRVKSNLDDKSVEQDTLAEKLSCVRMDEERLIRTICDNTNIPEDEVRDLFQNGESKDARYALERGMIHEIRELELKDPTKITVVASGSN